MPAMRIGWKRKILYISVMLEIHTDLRITRFKLIRILLENESINIKLWPKSVQEIAAFFYIEKWKRLFFRYHERREARLNFAPLNHLVFDNISYLEVKFECGLNRGDKVYLTEVKKMGKSLTW